MASLPTSELFDGQARVWNHAFNFIKTVNLKCAVELGIPDVINKHKKPMNLTELLNALSISQDKSLALYRLMRILTHSKFFIEVKIHEEDNINDEKGYWLTPASRLLLKDEPLSMAPFILSMLQPDMINPWRNLGNWFRSGHPTQFSMDHGMTFWEYLGKEPMSTESFNEGIASDSRLVASVILKDCKQVFEGLKSLVDVAGGTGTLAKAIASAYPEMKCIVFDLPNVVDGLEGDQNLAYVGGSMFEAIPPADAVLLKWALQYWSDEECVKILEKCREAIPSKDKGGKVIIIGIVVGNENTDEKGLETQLFFDVLVMIRSTGRERTEEDWAKIFSGAGFSSYKITPALGLRSVIEVFP
uniref:O-methyltransferase n=1 Tax=Scoparia dulcis TaxID=107240 RepID=A0A5H2Q6F1_SCODU|nr:O-methyltransferase [Scoparia dulcis]